MVIQRMVSENMSVIEEVRRRCPRGEWGEALTDEVCGNTLGAPSLPSWNYPHFLSACTSFRLGQYCLPTALDRWSPSFPFPRRLPLTCLVNLPPSSSLFWPPATSHLPKAHPFSSSPPFPPFSPMPTSARCAHCGSSWTSRMRSSTPSAPEPPPPPRQQCSCAARAP